MVDNISYVIGIILERLPPRFKDEGSQCISTPEGESVVLSAELVELTEDIVIYW